MTQRQTLLGWCYLLFSLLSLPSVLFSINGLLPKPMSGTALNLTFFCVNFSAVVGIFYSFIIESLKGFFALPWKCLGIALLGIVLYYLQELLITFVIAQVKSDFSNMNDTNILQMAQQHRVLMVFSTVVLVPITEELLHRGLVFQSLYRKNRLLAYGVSMCIFAGVHVMGYVGAQDGITLLLCFIQYLPAGLTLAFAYEKSDTVITPILMHAAINTIGLFATR